MNLKKEFGEKIRKIRSNRGLSQEKTAELIGIDPVNYSRLENGLSFPKPENLIKISEALNVELSELFQFSKINDYEKMLNAITEKLKNDEDTTRLVYKFLISLGKL